MIFDRTKNDVDEARRIREEKVKAFKALTDEEKDILERGMFTFNTINRIEEKQSELKNLISELGYHNISISSKKNWNESNTFTLSAFVRIIGNENALRNAFFVYSDTPPTPDATYHYESINALEKILYDLDVMINDVKSNYRECGNFECGEE